MKKLFTTSVSILIGLTLSSPGRASNGSHSTGASAAASAMAGTSQGNYTTETEAIFRNPALLGSQTKELLSPRLEISAAFAKHNSQGASNSTGSTLPDYTGSKDSLHVLPNFAAGMKITDWLTTGLGIVSVGGSTVDYTGVTSLTEQKSEQWTYRMTPTVAVKPIDMLQLGAGFVVGYSSVALNSGTPQSTRPSRDAWAVGGLFGAAVTPMEGLRFGASFQTKTKFTFKELYDLSSLTGTASGTLNDVVFEEPAELAGGVSYDLGDLRVALDVRRIFWKSADGYKQLGWEDQTTFGLGFQYRLQALSLRTGVIYGKSPIEDASGVNGEDNVDFQGVTVTKGGVDQANVIGFTAITEWEFDVGAGYQITEALSADLAFIYCPTKTVTKSGTFPTFASDYVHSSKANEWALIAGVNYQF